jgi:hypothetical protein
MVNGSRVELLAKAVGMLSACPPPKLILCQSHKEKVRYKGKGHLEHLLKELRVRNPRTYPLIIKGKRNSLMQEDNNFDGYMPSLHNIEISSSTPMITTDGDLINGHTVKLSLGDSSEVVFSCTVDQLQKLFFLILKTVA